MSESKSVVKFGTDGWRGIIADDFTYANVRVAARVGGAEHGYTFRAARTS